MLALLELAAKNKVVAGTRLNAASSRSHTLVTVDLKRTVRACMYHHATAATHTASPLAAPQIRDRGSSGGRGRWSHLHHVPASSRGTAPPARVLCAKLTFVDLAGSERTSKTKSGATLCEGGWERDRGLNRLLCALVLNRGASLGGGQVYQSITGDTGQRRGGLGSALCKVCCWSVIRAQLPDTNSLSPSRHCVVCCAGRGASMAKQAPALYRGETRN